MNKQNEKISVIVPVYNVEKYLRRCVDSILNQTYQNIEIILVDDGSPDNCGIICDEYAQKDTRVKVIHKENGGLSDARNAGLEVAEGDYIQFVDSDDYIHPQMSEILLCAIRKTKADLAICDFLETMTKQKMDDIKDNPAIVVIEKSRIMEQLEKRNLLTVVAWNKLYKKELWDNLRYPKGRWHEDEFVIHRLLHLCEKLVYVSSKLYFYYQRENSITSTLKLKNVEDAFEAYEDRLEFLKDNCYSSDFNIAQKHMLFLIVKYYGRLENIQDSADFRKKIKMRFQEILESEGVKASLDPEMAIKYELFCENPKKYYTYCKNELRIKKWKSTIKRIIKR